jgi:hypothetical protein
MQISSTGPRLHCARWSVGIALFASACASGPSERTVQGQPDSAGGIDWTNDAGASGGGWGASNGDGSTQPDAWTPADLGSVQADTSSSAPTTTPDVLERVLGFQGSGGTLWVHVASRAAGASAVSVRTVKISDTQTPPFHSGLAVDIQPGQSKTVEFSGTVEGGAPYTTTVSYTLSANGVTISHSATIDGVSAGQEQEHGVISLAPEAPLPYKRSLHYLGSGSSEWFHIATRHQDQTLVDVRTIRYNPKLTPPVYDHKIFGIAAESCKSDTTGGTFVEGGGSFETEIRSCRSGQRLVIDHRATIDGSSGRWQVHGDVPIL